MASLIASTQFLKNVIKETGALFQEDSRINGCDIPTVELREASLDETDLMYFIQHNGDQFPALVYESQNQDTFANHQDQDLWIKTNTYYLLTKELSTKTRLDPVAKLELLVRIYDKLGNHDKKLEQLRHKQHKIKQLAQDISKLEKKLAFLIDTDEQSEISSDIALLKEEAELDRLELQISKLKSGNIY